jgi:methylglutaconyl-CoA hydratase
MTEPTILTHIDEQGVATLTMNRPELHNAFDDVMVAALATELKLLDSDERVRIVRLAGSGKSFSAGADLNWMRRMATYGHEENLSDALALAGLLQTLNRLSKPTMALVQGVAYGGGVGLMACCDMVLAVERATFSLSEVKLGLFPSLISPYVIAAMGARACRRYFLSAETFDAREACRLGLVHEVVADQDALQELSARLAGQLLKNGPSAMSGAKRLIASVSARALDDGLIADTAKWIADQRETAEGREGLAAFLEKRKPGWVA